MEKSYRIKANVGKDQVLNINLQRDVDFYEILSLKLSQKKLYKLHTSDYGVIVGRVLANDAFGIPNARVSVFIPIKNEDKLRTDLRELYPYGFVNSYNNENKRFNILPNYPNNDCHKPVGSFPSKRNVLDEDILIEVYDKYYKYTTTTNNAGDYMIFGVPTGTQVVHTDIDLSDIGVLSQRPTDFIYKGYNIDLFESPSEFKQSTNLDELPQIISENTSVNVYPLWGDKSENEIAITRNDIRVQYKFEPTCVFLGSVVTDSSVNSMSHECVAGVKMGEASQLTPAEGTIEMIRKTVFDTVEEFSIKGNKLIDGNGVWCYQIPMNLDYVCTDEYGNISPTDNPNKGIPTRARVRFRLTLDESDNESLSSHKARYLIPNNPPLVKDKDIPYVYKKCLDDVYDNNNYYEFGTLTNDECFRDLLWNKVYSVKSYIPRVQKDKSVYGEKNTEYLSIKGVNKKDAGGINPFPFNKLNLNFSVPFFYLLYQYEWQGLSPFINFWRLVNGNQMHFTVDATREKAMEEMDAIGLDFYNDWINGCLYFPNWYWYLKEKNEYDGVSDSKYDSQFCDCDSKVSDDEEGKLCIYNNCSLPYTTDEMTISDGINEMDEVRYEKLYTKLNLGSQYFENGIIKKKKNKDGATLYYYSFGQPIYPEKKTDDGENVAIARLFSTDIILLGSLVDTDIHGIPKISTDLPSSTSTIPPIGKAKPDLLEDNDNGNYEEHDSDPDKSTVNGMHWGRYWDNETDEIRSPTEEDGSYKSKYGSGLFFGLIKKLVWEAVFRVEWYLVPYTDVKTCVNAERICELGVTNDSNIKVKLPSGDKVNYSMDGLITRREILDTYSRSLFATLNSDKMLVSIETDSTGYKTYNLKTFYQYNFDGRLERIAIDYTEKYAPSDRIAYTYDSRCKDYLDFRFNSIANSISIDENYTYGEGKNNSAPGGLGGKGKSGTRSEYKSTIDIDVSKRHFYEFDKGSYSFPLYENSFYFYFGINSAHNAISEFYKNFIGKCGVKKESTFLTIKAIPSKICEEYSGEIIISTEDIVYPYSISLSGPVEKSAKNINSNNYTISGLINGEYVLTVTDDVGKSSTETVRLRQEHIHSSYVINNIDPETNRGSLQILSYTLDGVTREITSFGYVIGKKVTLTVDDCEIIISVNGGEESMTDYLCDVCCRVDGDDKIPCVGATRHYELKIVDCDGSSRVEGNKICFKRAGTFIMRTQQISCREINYTEESFTIN